MEYSFPGTKISKKTMPKLLGQEKQILPVEHGSNNEMRPKLLPFLDSWTNMFCILVFSIYLSLENVSNFGGQHVVPKRTP